MQMSVPEQIFAAELEARGIRYETEYRFHPERKWRLDFAFPSMKIAVEIEGGIWIQGRHSRGDGMAKDMEKYNELSRLGWRLFRFTPAMIASGAAMDYLDKVLSCV